MLHLNHDLCHASHLKIIIYQYYMPLPVLQKEVIFQQLGVRLQQQGFTIAWEDPSRPWGGFFVIDEDQAQ